MVKESYYLYTIFISIGVDMFYQAECGVHNSLHI